MPAHPTKTRPGFLHSIREERVEAGGLQVPCHTVSIYITKQETYELSGCLRRRDIPIPESIEHGESGTALARMGCCLVNGVVECVGGVVGAGPVVYTESSESAGDAELVEEAA